MAGRPTVIDLQSRSNSAAGSFRPGLPSPRVQLFDGDIPPSLSPLDAFAAHSRKLALELEAVRNAGSRRVSRLPPAHVLKSLSEHQSDRPRYFRSVSEETQSGALSQDRGKDAAMPVMTHPTVRPVSEYPRLSGIPNLELGTQQEDNNVTPMDHAPPENPSQTTGTTSYFDVPRAESPEHASIRSVLFGEDVRKQTRDSQSSSRLDNTEKRNSNADSIASHPDLTFTLAPPQTGISRATNHMRIPKEGSDDDYASSLAGSTFSQPRKLSSSSGVSTPQSPRSPFVVPHARSPSLNSEVSVGGGSRRSKSNLNFSRPLSSSSLNRLAADSPSHAQLSDAQMAKYLGANDAPRPRPSTDEPRPESPEGYLSESGPSYTYAKFSLPRGRLVSRNSAVFQGISAPHFEWDEPMFPSTPPMTAITERSLDIPSPPPSLGRPSISRSDGARADDTGFSFDFPQRPKTPERPINRSDPSSPSSIQKPPTSLNSRPSVEQGEVRTFLAPQPILPAIDDSQSLSSKSNSTVRPQSSRTRSTANDMSAEEHVAKGIECHEKGDVKESTYHLRIAARENHPTGMLLYALACRHGWGMRANPREGVQWLRKAMDSAILEVADGESNERGSAGTDLGEKKTRRAQFALSIYELGVSHLNGWGVEQDKALALRCFEIAGSWGDSDALTEAGFCYAEGIGCKKDLKKAAKFYRMAEAKGVSMVGNSWIHKDKYNEVTPEKDRNSRAQTNDGTREKRQSKSRTRGIFGRKKSFQP